MSTDPKESIQMSFNAKYNATEMSILLEAKLTPVYLRGANGDLKKLQHGSSERAYGYDNEHALVLFPVTDRIEPLAQLRTIDVGIVDVQNEIAAAINSRKKIILPVVENQKILGLVPRRHFVTLVYDPVLNMATLIDSRPWLISFLYPTKPMEKMLKQGLEQVLSVNQMAAMKFKKVFQGVQHNDTHCGAWTAANIMGLAGVGIDGSKAPNNTCQQANAFTRDDEVDVVNNNISIANTVYPDPIVKLSKPTGWFQKLLIRLGFSKYKLSQTIDPVAEMSDLSSYGQIAIDLPMGDEGVPHEWEMTPAPTVVSSLSTSQSDEDIECVRSKGYN